MAHPNRLPVEYRIRQRREYRRVQSRGRTFRQPHLTMLYLPASENSRFGITVSRKVGNAVIRNRVKRRIREILRHHWRDLQGAWDIVVIARPYAANASFSVLENEYLGFSSWLSGKAS